MIVYKGYDSLTDFNNTMPSRAYLLPIIDQQRHSDKYSRCCGAIIIATGTADIYHGLAAAIMIRNAAASRSYQEQVF